MCAKGCRYVGKAASEIEPAAPPPPGECVHFCSRPCADPACSALRAETAWRKADSPTLSCSRRGAASVGNSEVL